MSLMDRLESTKLLLDGLRAVSQDVTPVSGKSLGILTDSIISLLEEGLTAITGMYAGKPYPPSDLVAEAVVPGQVDLSWSKALLDVDYQQVERSLDGVSWSPIGAPLPSTDESYSDTTVLFDTRYFYRVYAGVRVGSPQTEELVWDQSSFQGAAFPDPLVGSIADALILVAPKNGKITNFVMYVDDPGTDAVDPLFVEADVKIGGVSALSTKAKIDKTAAAQSSTYLADTGVTPAVFDADYTLQQFSEGDQIRVSLDLTQTSPDTPVAGVMLFLEVDLGDVAESDPSNVVAITTPVGS